MDPNEMYYSHPAPNNVNNNNNNSLNANNRQSFAAMQNQQIMAHNANINITQHPQQQQPQPQQQQLQHTQQQPHMNTDDNNTNNNNEDSNNTNQQSQLIAAAAAAAQAQQNNLMQQQQRQLQQQQQQQFAATQPQPQQHQMIVPQINALAQQQQQQYSSYVAMLQKYTLMLQQNPDLRQDRNFIQQYITVKQAVDQIKQQLQPPAKVIVGGNGLQLNGINTQQPQQQIIAVQRHQTAPIQQQQQHTPQPMDFSGLNFENIGTEKLPDLSSYLNANESPNPNPPNQAQSNDNDANDNDNSNNNEEGADMDLRRIPKYNPQNISDTTPKSPNNNNSNNVQLSLPNLNESMFNTNSNSNSGSNSNSNDSNNEGNQLQPQQPPNHSNNITETPGAPQSVLSSIVDDAQSAAVSKPKRGRGRPKGSRNKKNINYNLQEIENDLKGKDAEIATAKSNFDKAKQTYVSISSWLKNSAEAHRQQLVQQYYGSFASHPQYATQYTPQQLHAFAQQSANQKWQHEQNKLQSQLSNAYNDMTQLQNKIKGLNNQVLQLTKKRNTAARNTPSGPIADFEAQYMNKRGGLTGAMAMDSRYSNGGNTQQYHQRYQQQQRSSYQQQAHTAHSYPANNNPWQAIIDSNVGFVPQWVQCTSCRKWRVLSVSTRDISTWLEPSNWACSYGEAPNNSCDYPQEKPDQSAYSALQLTALTIQRQIKMEASQKNNPHQAQHGSNTVLQQRMHAYQKRMEFENKNNETFGKLMGLIETRDRKEADERFELLKKQKVAEKAAIRVKRKEKEATRQAKKKKLKGKDSDDEYLPDSDDTTDDEEYGESESDLDEDEMLLNRQAMRSRHAAPSSFNFKALLATNWTHNEIMALVAFAAANDNQFTTDLLAQDAELSARHNNPRECQAKLEEIMLYAQQMQNPSKSSSAATAGYTTRSGGRRNKSVGSDDEEYDGDLNDEDDHLWSGQRKSTRLAKKKKKRPNYAEEQAIDKYLAREEAEVLLQQKQANDIYEEKIERILAVCTVFVAPKTDHVYDDMQHALDNGCKASELLEQTRYFIKLEGISYLHCEWETEQQMVHRFGKLRVNRKITSWQRVAFDYESKCGLLWGGEPYDPSFSEVDRIIDCIDVNGEKKYYVKWMGLSYSCCTYETAQDIDCADKITQYEQWNKIPADTKKRHLDDLAFKKGMYGWYKIREGQGDCDQPAQNAADAKMKQELREDSANEVVSDEQRTYKGENKLRDYQVIGLNWLIQKFYEGSNSILADEMGLGKTIQSTCFIEHLFRVNNIHGPFLIVAPLSTLFHWKREIETWTDLNCVVYHDSERGQVSREIIRNHEFYYSKSQRKTPKFNILLTTYEILMCDLEWLANIKWVLCVVDEGHRLKSRSTQLSKSFELLDAQRRILLTGTPIQNSMDELFNLLHFLEPTEFQNFRDFNRSYGGNMVDEHSQINSSTQVNALQLRIQQYILRRLKENVEKSIPKKEETIIDIELTTIQKTYYRALFDRNREFLEAGVDKGNLPNLINLEVQLRKCCNHPWLIDGTIDRECGEGISHEEYMEKTIAASGKMVLLDKLLPKLKREGHRVLIFSQMRKVLNILQEYLDYKRYKYERFDGTTKSHDRQAAIDRFCAPNSDRLVFLLTTRAGGQGLNLVAADTVIIFDSDWNPQQDIQAQARCHRIGQHKAVSVYRLVTKNTYEAQMFERASKKLGLGQAILKSVEHGVKKKDVQDLKQLDNMLRHGAYAILNDEDAIIASKKWQECDIDELLQHAAHRIDRSAVETNNNNAGIGMHSFTRKTFESDKAKATASLDVTGENFWNDLWKIKKQQQANDDDNNLYLDNYLLDDKTRADRLLTSLTSMKDAANELAKAKRKDRGEAAEESDEDSDVIDDEMERIFATDRKRDKWFKRYKLHMVKMVHLKESPTNEVPSLELQIQLSNLVLSLQKHFHKKQKREIQSWNNKLTQRNRRKTKNSLNEHALSQPYLYRNNNIAVAAGGGSAGRRSKRKRKRGNNEFMDGNNNKKRKGNDARDKLDGVWAFDYPSYAFNWADSCAVCERGGNLILCEGPCVGSFHFQCIGLAAEPKDDPWYCQKCKQLKAKREEVYALTGGKSSRFKPNTYVIKIWMDNNNSDDNDVHEFQTECVLTAKCFYPSEKKAKTAKSSKSSRRSTKRKKKRSRSQMETEDYNIDSDEFKPRKRRRSNSVSPKKKMKTKSKSKSKAKNKSLGEDILSDFATRMTRSRKKNLSKILNEGKENNEDKEAEQNSNDIDGQKQENNQFIDFNALGNFMNLKFANNNNQSGLNNNNVNVNGLNVNNMLFGNVNNMSLNNMNVNNVNENGNNTTIINNITNIHNINNAANNTNHNGVQARFGNNFAMQ